MKLLFRIFLLAALFVAEGCRESDNSNENVATWAPAIVVTNVDEGVQLKLIKVNPLSLFRELALLPHVEYRDPLFYELMMSGSGLDSWEQVGTYKFDADTVFVKISGLNAGSYYYFKAVSKARNNLESESEPVMIATKSSDLGREEMSKITESRKSPGFSPDKSFRAFPQMYNWDENHGQTSVFIKDLTTSEEILIEKNSFKPSWSPRENIVGYLSEEVRIETENGTERTSLVSVYFLEEDTIIRLTDQYFACEPSWSHNGEWITYILNSPFSSEYNIWKVNVYSKEAIKVLGDIGGLDELALADDKSARNPVFSVDDTKIIFSRRTMNSRFWPQNIFQVPASGEGEIEQLTNSDWDDSFPVASSDGRFISFVSNRTGESRVWCVDQNSQKLYLIEN